MELKELFQPKSFLGLTTLRNGVITIAVINLILTFLSFLGFGVLALYGTIISVLCTVLGLLGVYKENPVFIMVYLIYMVICTLLSWSLVTVSLLTFGIIIILCLLSFFINVYACCVINSYHNELKLKVLTGNTNNIIKEVPVNNTSDFTIVNVSANNVADNKDITDKIARNVVNNKPLEFSDVDPQLFKKLQQLRDN